MEKEGFMIIFIHSDHYIHPWIAAQHTCLGVLPSARQIEILHGGLKAPAIIFWSNNNAHMWGKLISTSHETIAMQKQHQQ